MMPSVNSGKIGVSGAQCTQAGRPWNPSDAAYEKHLADCDECWNRHESALRTRSDQIKQAADRECGVTIDPLEDVVLARRVEHKSDLSVLFKGWLCEAGIRRLVALKCAKPCVGDSLARFALEYDRLSTLKLDVLPEFIGPPKQIAASGMSSPPPTYIIMEWIDGCRIEDHSQWQGGESQPLRLFAAVCRAVGELHINGVVHRDIKPSHILITDQGVKILDLGVAKVLQRAEAGNTQLGNIQPGAPRYMSPEQFDPGKYRITSPSTDVWGLGVTLFELLTGEHPFVQSALSRLDDYQTAALRAPKIRWPELARAIPPPVRQVVEIALARSPYGRYADGHALARALELCAETVESDTPRNRRILRWYNGRRCPVQIAPHFLVLARSLFGLLLACGIGFGLARIGGGWLADPSASGSLNSVVPENLRLTREQMHVIEIDDGARVAFPEYARQAGLEGVTVERKTWRPVVAHLLKKLIPARPRAVVVDLMFEEDAPNPIHDEFLVGAIQELSNRGIPIVLGMRGCKAGRPLLAAPVLSALCPKVTYGLSYAANQKFFPGQVLLAAQIDDCWEPGLIASAYSAILQPGCPSNLSWNDAEKLLELQFTPANDGGSAAPRLPWHTDAPHQIPVFESRRNISISRGKLPNLAPLLFGQTEIDLHQEGRTVRIENFKTLLDANPEQVQTRFQSKVIFIGDTQQEAEPSDRHAIGLSGGRPVAGVYLVADAVASLLADRYRMRLFVEDKWASLTYVLALFAGLTLGLGHYWLHTFIWFRGEKIRRFVSATVVVIAAAAMISMWYPHGRALAHLSLAFVGLTILPLACIILLSRPQQREYRRVQLMGQ